MVKQPTRRGMSRPTPPGPCTLDLRGTGVGTPVRIIRRGDAHRTCAGRGQSFAAIFSSVFQLRAVAVTPKCFSRREYDSRIALTPCGVHT